MKRNSREKKDDIGELFENKQHWRSMERSLEPKEGSENPRSASRGKKKSLKSQGEGVNFNFNWTKVNKLLTNPLLINKAVGNGTH